MLAIAHFFVIVFDDYANLPGSLKIKENRKNTGNRVPMCKIWQWTWIYFLL